MIARYLGYGAVLGSVTLNAWWLLGPGTAGAPDDRRSDKRSGAAGAAPASVRPSTFPSGERARLDECRRVLATAARELDAARVQLGELGTPQQRFHAAPRDEATEARVREPILAAITAVAGVPAPALECRGTVCQIRIHARTHDQATAATDAVRTDPAVRTLADAFMVEAGTPVPGGFEVALYLVTDSGPSATSQLEALIAEVRASEELARCAAVGRHRGTLEAQLTVTEDAGLSLSLGGPLAETPVGQCIGGVLRTAVAAARLLPGTRAGTVYASFESPYGP